MATKRTRDPAGLLHDHVAITGPSPDQFLGMLTAAAPRARIARLRRHDAMQAKADELEALLLAKGGKADHHLHALIASAEHDALYLDAAPSAIAARKAEAQRRVATAVAVRERKADAGPAGELARTLASSVSERIKKQGLEQTAKEVKRLASTLATPASERLSGFTVRWIRTLIEKKD